MCAPERRRGFSLVELVIAIGIVSFALISIIGLVAVSVTTHANSSTDAVFSIMTETALQEVRNYNTAANPLSANVTSAYNFTKLATTFTTAAPGFIYFDVDGQIAADNSAKLPNTGGNPVLTASTATLESTEMGNAGASSNSGRPGMPLTAAASPLPANAVYTCQIVVKPVTLAGGSSTTPNMYLVILTFYWPSSAPVQHKSVVSSISNTVN